jgi:FMN phosphatase YigB (HAD superfamily)
VGQEKPHPGVFQVALLAMQAKAAESLYVGDVCSVDYVGARNAGMQAILFDVAGAYRDRGLARVESLAELEGWLKSQSSG